MNQSKTMKSIVALFALTLTFALAGCKGESSPTAPPVNSGGGTPSGGTTPPTGAAVTLTVSNANPVVNSTSVVTATVTVNNQPAPNGTAVEFVTNFGKWTETSTADTPAKTAIITTVNGKASATLTATEAGTAAVTATVNNVTKGTVVTFSTVPVINPQPSTAPTITSVTPAIVSPNGGQIVTITGTNFREPITVFFDPGTGAAPIPVQKVSSTDTTIQVITPKINLAAGQQQKFGIIVITQQGSASEQRATIAATATNALTFQLDVLTPTVNSVSPSSGSIDGGTRVTIYGSGFQEPMQVFFGAAEAKIVLLTFDEITAVTPPARDAGVTTGTVNVRLLNSKTGKTVTATGLFRYAAPIAITAVGPTEGPVSGGTRVTIEGSGFNDPVTVVLGGVSAQVVSVSGTRVVAVTSPVALTNCADVPGTTTVLNIDNGESAIGPNFTYRLSKPFISSVASPGTLGGTTTVTIQNPLGSARFTIGDSLATIISSTPVVGSNAITYTIQIPANLKLDVATCPGISGVSAQQPTAFDVVYTSSPSTCTDTAKKGLTVNPTTAVVGLSPASFTPFTATAANLAAMPPTPFVPATPQLLTVTNAGGGTLTVNSVSTAGAGCANFSFNAQATPSALNTCDPFAIVANYTPPAATPPGQNDFCSLIISTSAGSKTLILSGSVH